MILEQSNFLMSFKLMLRTNYKLENGNIPWGKQISCIKKKQVDKTVNRTTFALLLWLYWYAKMYQTLHFYSDYSVGWKSTTCWWEDPIDSIEWMDGWMYHCGTNKTCVFPQPAILSGLQPLQEGRADPPHPSQTPRSRLSPRSRCGPVTIPDWGGRRRHSWGNTSGWRWA